MLNHELLAMSDEELSELKNKISKVLKDREDEDPINVERKQVIMAIDKGWVDFKKSTTLMEWLGNFNRNRK